MSIPIEVQKNPDGSWTAKGGTSLTVVSVTAVTEHKAVAGHAVAISAIQNLGKGWIKCSDQLPPIGVVVLASGFKFESYGGGRWVEPVIYDEGFHPLQDNGEGEYVADFDGEMNEVSHWQPLPSPPAE